MKLASRRQGRDGTLLLVSRDLERCVPAGAIAPTLQMAIDDWDKIAPSLRALAAALEQGGGEPFRPQDCASPLPRAFQWADGSAYLNHVELVRRARGADMPESFRTDPLIYQGGSDCFLGPTDPILAADEAWGIDLEGEVAVIVGDVPMGADLATARASIRLVLLVNDVSLRNLIPNELAKGFGFFHGKPPTAFSPVAVTPDELGTAWDGAKLSQPLLSWINGTPLGTPDAGADMHFDFPQLIAHAAKTRPLAAGTIIGSGTVSNRGADGGPGKPVEQGGRGYSCLAELRTVETLRDGKPSTPFLKFGDRVRLEMRDGEGRSIFGAIDQVVQCA